MNGEIDHHDLSRALLNHLLDQLRARGFSESDVFGVAIFRTDSERALRIRIVVTCPFLLTTGVSLGAGRVLGRTAMRNITLERTISRTPTTFLDSADLVYECDAAVDSLLAEIDDRRVAELP